MGLPWVLRAPRKAHGHRVIAIAAAKDHRNLNVSSTQKEKLIE
jgi:hypothetical protein